MPALFGHEKLHVYQTSLDYARWAYHLAGQLKGFDRYARDQLIRASQSIPQNIAEGNGKGTKVDRRRFFEISRGSALECAAIQDILETCEAIPKSTNIEGKQTLVRIVSMLTKLETRNYELAEPDAGFDYDNDYDNDND